MDHSEKLQNLIKTGLCVGVEFYAFLMYLLSGHRSLSVKGMLTVVLGLYEASSCAVESAGSLLAVAYVYTNKSPGSGFAEGNNSECLLQNSRKEQGQPYYDLAKGICFKPHFKVIH